MERSAVYEICKRIAPKYGYDPILILALCEQESSYDESALRLEQGYYVKYVKPQVLASTVKVMFSASYGLTQLMGMSLYEAGYFDPVTNKDVAHQLDQYMVQPELQVEYGCKWLKKKQGSGSIVDGLRRYNGSAEYPPKVLARYERLKDALAPRD
jgi:soluble lytic murein transglycosylase-like protein